MYVEDEPTVNVEILREHHPNLYAELREVVCDREYPRIEEERGKATLWIEPPG